MAMQSTNDYLLRLAIQEHKSQSRAQIAIKSCEIATQTIRKAMAKIVKEERRKPTITRKDALKANKRDYQPLKAVDVTQKVEIVSVEDRSEIVPYYQSSKHSMDSAKSFDFYIDQDFDKKADEKAHTFESVSRVSADLLTLKASSIRVIDIGGQGLGDHIVMDLLSQLRGSCVVELSLYNNKLTDESMIRLSTVLPTLSRLSSLNISANQIRDKGVQAICSADTFPFSLKHLDISRNLLGPVSAYHIGNVFVPQSKKSSEVDIDEPEAKNVLNIQRLLLGGNQLLGSSTEFNRILMSFLCQNGAHMGLQSLSLPKSGLESEGLITVAAYIACSSSVTYLNVSSNAFAHEYPKLLFRHALLANRSLRHICIGQCNLTRAERKLFNEEMLSTCTLSWREKTSLSIAVGCELNICAKARYDCSVKEFSYKGFKKPPEWAESIFLPNEIIPGDIISLPVVGDRTAIPYYIISSILHLNKVASLLLHLEKIIVTYKGEEEVTETETKAVINGTELRKRREKIEVVKVMLSDYKSSLDGDCVVNPEVVAMVIEDLLSTLIQQESLVAQHIAVMYSSHQEGGRRISIINTMTTSRRNSSIRGSISLRGSFRGSGEPMRRTGSIMSFSSLLNQVKLGSAPEPAPDILYQTYLGDAAIFIHFLYVIRPLEYQEKIKADFKIEKNKREQLLQKEAIVKTKKLKPASKVSKGRLKGKGKGSSTSSPKTLDERLELASNLVSSNLLDKIEPRRNSRNNSLLLTKDQKNLINDEKKNGINGRKHSLNNIGDESSQTKSFFTDKDRDVFIKLKDLNLDQAEVERAILSRSKQNQRQEIYQCNIINLPNHDSLFDDEKFSNSMLLEDEAPRCNDKMMNLQNENTTERTIVETEYFRLASAHRIHQRKSDFS